MTKLLLWVATVLCAVCSLASSVFTDAVPSEGGSVSGGGMYADDIRDTLVRAIPNTGYEFAGWYLDVECENPVLNPGVGGCFQNPMHVDPRSHPSLYAKFIPSSQTHVTGCALPKNGGLVESVDADGITSFTAIPNTGYKFAGWFLDTGCHTIFSTDSSLNYLQNPISCVSSSNIVLNAKFVLSLPSWAVGKWSGSLDFHHHGDNEVGDTATFICDVNEDGWWNSTCVWVNMGTNIVEATATNIISVSSSEVKLEGYYYFKNYYVWQMTLCANGLSTFRSVQVDNGNLCVGGCEKMSSSVVAVPTWIEGLWIGSLDYHVGGEVGVSDRGEFKCMISTNGSWQATCKWESMGTMVLFASSTAITNISSEEISISGCYYCGNRFDWEMRLRNTGESSFHATKTGDDDALSGTLSKDSSSPAIPLPDGGRYTETVDGIEWTFAVVNGEASVGAWSCGYRAVAQSISGDVFVPKLLGGRCVTSIGERAFYECTNLTSVSIPSGVTRIDENAFNRCNKMESITIPSSLKNVGVAAFRGCGVTNVTIPCGQLTYIATNMFRDCGALTSVDIPTNVTGIGRCAFEECEGLRSVNLPNWLTRIEDSAFEECKNLTSISIPEGVTSIEMKLFSNCYSLKSVTMPSSIISICERAFYWCTGLQSVAIPFGVRVIEERVFADCSNLETVSIPSSVTNIGERAFENCSALKTVYVDKGDANRIAELYEWGTGVIFIEVSRELPDLGDAPTMEEITNVFNAAEDPNLAQKITNETEYVAFREWSGKVKPQGGSEPAGAAGVMAAPNAWLSYALGSETLIESVPTNGQMRIVSFEPNTNSTASAGRFDFTIRIDDIAIGDDAKTNNLAQIFGLEGGTSLEPGGMSSTNVDITFGAPQDGKVKFTAGPRDANTKTFFMKVKMTP